MRMKTFMTKNNNFFFFFNLILSTFENPISNLCQNTKHKNYFFTTLLILSIAKKRVHWTKLMIINFYDCGIFFLKFNFMKLYFYYSQLKLHECLSGKLLIILSIILNLDDIGRKGL